MTTPAWWLSLLPLAAGLMTLVGVRWTIKAGDKRAKDDRAEARQLAIDDRKRAREADFLAWQRDNLLAISTQVSVAAIAAQDRYGRMAHSHTIDCSGPDAFAETADLGKEINSATARLTIIGAHELADACREIRASVNNVAILSSVMRLNSDARHLNSVESSADQQALEIIYQRIRQEEGVLERLLDAIGQARERFGKAAEIHLLATSDPDWLNKIGATEYLPPSKRTAEPEPPQAE